MPYFLIIKNLINEQTKTKFLRPEVSRPPPLKNTRIHHKRGKGAGAGWEDKFYFIFIRETVPSQNSDMGEKILSVLGILTFAPIKGQLGI